MELSSHFLFYRSKLGNSKAKFPSRVHHKIESHCKKIAKALKIESLIFEIENMTATSLNGVLLNLPSGQ